MTRMRIDMESLKKGVCVYYRWFVLTEWIFWDDCVRKIKPMLLGGLKVRQRCAVTCLANVCLYMGCDSDKLGDFITNRI